MENIASDIKKIVYIFEKDTNETTEAIISVSVPLPVGDARGTHYCYVEFERQLGNKTKLFGVDAFQTLIIAIKFLERLLSSTYPDFEVRNQDGTKYSTIFTLFEEISPDGQPTDHRP